MRRLSPFLGLCSFSTVAAIAIFSAAGCNAQLATVLASDDAATQPGTEDGNTTHCSQGECDGDGGTNVDGSTPTTGDCTKFGGVCLPQGETAPPNRKPAGPGQGTCTGTDVCWVPETNTPVGQACAKDSDCNPSNDVSSLHGHCFHGICICNVGTVQPSGKCGPTTTDCKKQGGSCHQQPAKCPDGKIGSDDNTNMTCGDFVEAICCHESSNCKGPAVPGTGGNGWVPVDFTCCGPVGGARDPICVNGWKTCPSKHTPVDKTKGGCL